MKNLIYSFLMVVLAISCSKSDVPMKTGGDTTTSPSNPVVKYGNVDMWLTQSDKSALFAENKNAVSFTSATNSYPDIEVDSAQQYQQIDGFGFCLTDGSAELINNMPPDAKAALLKELFSTDGTSIGISYIRVSIGASDLSDSVYSYDDMPAGQTDEALAHFSIDKANINLIPVVKQILAINPDLKILGSPWSAPVWMKDNGSSKGGSLKPQYYDAYAAYFVKYIQAMRAAGIHIDAITPQNEPLNPDNNPSMYMPATDEAAFIKTALGPAFQAASIDTKIWAYDHNCDQPQYPLTILDDAAAAQYVDGSAFHLYNGDISALTTVHNVHPDKNIYFTEQYTASGGSFGDALSWHIQNLIIGATKNWSRNVLEWNLASDPNLGPHTLGGCTTCLGAVTINGSNVSRNQSYYIIAHAAKFVRPGSHRVATTDISNITNVAFVTPDGKKVLIAMNTSSQPQTFNIKYNGHLANTTLKGGAVATYVW